MKVVDEFFDSVKIIQLNNFEDERGFFLETYKRPSYEKMDIFDNFVQDNQSRSLNNILRGMHFTINKPQSQLVTVLKGEIFDVVIDLRKDSKTFGEWKGVKLSDRSIQQIFMPHGFAHGFLVLSDWADLHYKVSKIYNPLDERGILWSDPEIAIDWPSNNPIVSAKDQQNPTFSEFYGSVI